MRLVAYRLEGRAITPFLNEKVMAGLGRNLGATGKLSPEGIEAALKALARFAVVIKGLGLKDVFAVATAAVRDAKDGEKFAERVRKETGIALRVIEGAEEARLSALGVLAGAPEATGVVGDLGGSSLELVEVGANGPGRGETWPLGPFSLMAAEPFDADRVAAVVTEPMMLNAGAIDTTADRGALVRLVLMSEPLGAPLSTLESPRQSSSWSTGGGGVFSCASAEVPFSRAGARISPSCRTVYAAPPIVSGSSSR